MVLKKESLIQELSEVEKMNKLLSSKLNLDFIETIYREKLKFGKKRGDNYKTQMIDRDKRHPEKINKPINPIKKKA